MDVLEGVACSALPEQHGHRRTGAQEQARAVCGPLSDSARVRPSHPPNAAPCGQDSPSSGWVDEALRQEPPTLDHSPLCLEMGRQGLGPQLSGSPLLPVVLLSMSLARRYGGTFQNVSVKLPITLNKFFQPTEMASQDFFQRWKQLSR